MNRRINQSMEICKLVASVFVVFIHIKFPGEFGNIVESLARFAVPTFFAISGYFSYNVDCVRLKKRLNRILKLNIYGTVLYLLWAVYYVVFVDGKGVTDMLLSKFSMNNIAKWVIMNINPFSGHLWYLSAILVCYIFLWIYVKYFENKQINYYTLYVVSFCMIMIQFAFGVFSAGSGTSFHYTLYRNVLFFGMPMFTMGIFIRENGQRIIQAFSLSAKKEILIIALGLAFSVIQCKGIGKEELPVGSLIASAALILLMAEKPTVSFLEKRGNALARACGDISLTVYIVHILFANIYKVHLENYSEVSQTYWYPLLIVALSLITGFVLYIIKSFVTAIKSAIKTKGEAKCKKV